jgi:hypothetical protein
LSLLIFCLLSSNESRACGSLPAGADPSWQTSVQAALASEEYHASIVADGQLQAPNRAHDLRTRFHPEGIDVVPRDGSPGWRFGWELRRFGRSGRMEVTGPAAPTHAGAQVRYTRPGLVEWYENTPRGLEQGFTIERRPAGDGPLTIEGQVDGGLTAELREEEGAIDFRAGAGNVVLRYTELHVWDARGQDIASWLEASPDRVLIRVDDRDAIYPLTIDPLLVNPAWTGEGNQASAQFGYSVSTAGDVNADGYSDVIVGVPFYDNGDQDEGRTLLFHGSPSGLSTTPAWTAEGNQFNVRFGWSVGAAGDVNGDGYSDVIVGVRTYANGQLNEGRAVIYSGSPSGLGTSPSWAVESNQMNAELGYSVGTAGDVNGDGFSDVIVGVRMYDNGQTDEGRALVYHGTASGPSLNFSWSVESNQATAWFGWAVGTAGDVNGDGFADVIVGAMLYDNGQDTEGRAYVYHGSSTGLAISASWTAESNQIGAEFGNAVGTAGDVNGDGYSDVIVGAFTYDNGQADEGRAFVYHGSAAGLSPAAAWTGESGQIDAEFGYAVGTAGDVNGDGYADVVIGARAYSNDQPSEGRAYFYQGSATGLPNTLTQALEADQASAEFGAAVATAGDVNGDGFSDVIIAARIYSNGQAAEGRAFVYHGAPAALNPLGPTQTVEQNNPSSGYGTVVASAGDVNGDGYTDLIVSNVLQEVFVYHGSRTGFGSTPAWTAVGPPLSRFGYAVASAGDVNGDGYSDVVIGAYDYDNGENNEGGAFLYLGSPTGLGATPAWITESNQIGANYGRAVTSAGDVNGDGYSDVVVTANEWDNGEIAEGAAFVFHGSPTGLPANPDQILEGNLAFARLGYSASGAGDVNGDGYSDVILGTPSYTNGETQEGRAYVFHGSATGLEPTAGWVVESNVALSYFGFSVANAGDTNQDGYSDVIIGAYGYSNGESEEGAVFLYYGSEVGLSDFADWSAESNQFLANYGSSVASAGDVNGDGYSDVVVGAPQYQNGQASEGGAYGYLGRPSGLAFGWLAESNQEGGDFGYSVATAGDVTGDGFSDVIVGDPRYTNGQALEGVAFLYAGNCYAGASSPGLNRIATQRRMDNSAPIAVLGRSDIPDGFLLRALGRNAIGRSQVRLQAEVKPYGVPFDGSGLVEGSFFNTGTPGGTGSAITIFISVEDLDPDRLYHWRLRIAGLSPYFPRTPWLTLPMNGLTEADLRTDFDLTAVTDPSPSPARGQWLEPGAPNPFGVSTALSYTLPERGHALLGIYDVQGRQVARIADEVQLSGRHTVRWDGRGTRGQALPAGVYLVRLEFAGKVETKKIVLQR